MAPNTGDESKTETKKDWDASFIPWFHAKVTWMFGQLGVLIALAPIVFIIIAAILFIVLMVGAGRLEKEKTITDLWAMEDTRMEREKGFYESHFGGLSNPSLALFIAIDPNAGIANAQALGEIVTTLTPIFQDTPSINQIHINITDGSGNPKKVAVQELCEAPVVPPIWRPGGSIANAYTQYLGCLAMPGTPASMLSPAWGIDRFPCSRASVLDCFQEGAFNYPPVMATLMTIALPAALNPSRAGCISAIEAGASAAFGPAIAAQLAAGLDSTIDAFASFGFVGRPSFASMTPAQIIAHINAGVKNLEDQSVTVSQCLGGVPCCLSWAGTRNPAELTLGVLTRNATTNDIEIIGATQNVINLANTDHPSFVKRFETYLGRTTSADERNDILESWELKYINHVLALRAQRSAGGFATRLEVAASRSNGDIVATGAEVETGLIVIGYIIMILFTMIVLGNWRFPCRRSNFVDSHSLLGLGGIIVIAISTGASFGLAGWLDMLMSPVNVNIVPFLSLGLGIDDMFVMAHTMTRLERAGSPKHRMLTTFELAGPSVFLTSISNFLAFMITSAVPIPVIRTFAYQMSMAVVLNFLFLLLLFGPMMVYDAKRMAANRIDLILIKSSDDLQSPMAAVSLSNVNVDDVDGQARLAVKEDQSPFTVFARDIYGPFLMNPIVKVLVIIIFTVMFGLLTYNGFANNQVGIRPSDIALDDSYQAGYLGFQERHFPSYTSVLVSAPTSFPAAQQGLLDLQNAIQQDKWVVTSLRVSQASWLNSMLNTAGSPDTPLPEAAFYPAFQAWATTTGSVYSFDMSCKDSTTGARVECSEADANTVIAATRVSVVERNLVRTPQFLDMMENQRMAADLFNELDAKNSNFMYGYVFLFWEQYEHVYDNLYRIAGYSLLGVFIATLLLQMSPGASVLLVIVILMIDCEIFGIIDLIDARLNGFSLGNLVMSIGLSVEFTAHITRAFLVTHAGDRNARVIVALEEMFAPVTYGAMSSALPIIPIAFAEFPFFRTYYAGMFSLMVLFAYLNGIILLPVLLSIFGPRPITNPEVPKSPGSASTRRGGGVGGKDAPCAGSGADNVAEAGVV